jgi:hypothetical protein
MNKYLSIFFIVFLIFNTANAQRLLGNKEEIFTRQDSLRGSITKERAWWDLKKYHLDIKVNPADSTISGSNTVRYKVLNSYNRMQIDLQEPLKITKAIQDGKELNYQRNGNVFYIDLVAPQKVGEVKEVVVFYNGKLVLVR